jgi:hypothetical protein
MADQSPTKKLEEHVREMRDPLNELLQSLDPTIRPAKRAAYALNNDFDDEFGEWADDTPPPWEGEDRVV